MLVPISNVRLLRDRHTASLQGALVGGSERTPCCQRQRGHFSPSIAARGWSALEGFPNPCCSPYFFFSLASSIVCLFVSLQFWLGWQRRDFWQATHAVLQKKYKNTSYSSQERMRCRVSSELPPQACLCSCSYHEIISFWLNCCVFLHGREVPVAVVEMINHFQPMLHQPAQTCPSNCQYKSLTFRFP